MVNLARCFASARPRRPAHSEVTAGRRIHQTFNESLRIWWMWSRSGRLDVRAGEMSQRKRSGLKRLGRREKSPSIVLRPSRDVLTSRLGLGLQSLVHIPASLHCQTVDTGLVHRAVCLFH